MRRYKHGTMWLPYTGEVHNFCINGLGIIYFSWTHTTHLRRQNTKMPSHDTRDTWPTTVALSITCCAWKRVTNIAGLRLLSWESLHVAPSFGTWELAFPDSSSFTDDNGARHLTCWPSAFSVVYVRHPLCFREVMNLEWAEGAAGTEPLRFPGR